MTLYIYEKRMLQLFELEKNHTGLLLSDKLISADYEVLFRK